MQELKITSGTWEVLANGHILSNGLNPIDFELTKDMILRIAVKSAPDGEPSIDLVPEGSYLTITYTNPNTILHFGSKEAIEVGSYKGRDLFIQIRINTFGDFTSFSADYTFYLGAESG